MFAPLLAPFLLWPLMQAAPVVPVTAESFVPADAMFVARLRSPEVLSRAVEPFMPGAPGPGGPTGMPAFDVLDPLRMVIPAEIPWELLDRTQPVLIAGRPGLEDPMEGITIVASSTDPAAFVAGASLADSGWTCTTAGKLVVLSNMQPGPMLAPASPILAGLDRHELVVRVSMDQVMEAYGEMVRQGLDQAAMEAEEDPASGAGATAMHDWVSDAIESIEMLELNFSHSDGDTRLGIEMAARAGTPLGSVERVDASALPAALRALDPAAPLAFVSVCDYTRFMSFYREMFDAMLAEAPDVDAAQLDSIMDTYEDVYAAMGPTFSGSVRLDGDGMHGAGLMRPPDPAALVQAFADMGGTGMEWLKVSGPELTQVAGLDVSTLRMRFDFAALAGMSAQAAAAGPAAVDEMSDFMDKLFGPDGLSISFATRDGAVLVGYGSPREIAPALARVEAKEESPLAASLRRAMGTMNPGFAYHVDLGRLFEDLPAFMERLDPDRSPMALEAMRPMAGLPPFVMVAGVDGRVWKFAISTDAARLAEAIRSMRSAAFTPVGNRAMVLANIMAITNALNEFAMNNAGQYPPDLEVLVMPDMNGVRYLDQESIPLDPWGRPFLYEPPSPGQPQPRVYTLGADGKPGGTGDDQDVDSLTLSDEDR